MDKATEALRVLTGLLYNTETGNEMVDNFVWHSSWILEIVAVLGVIFMIL